MNGQEYKNAFGKAPESFKSRVTFTLSRVEEERKMKKFSARLVLIAGILLILMAGVVYAASTEWKLLDFFSGMYGLTPGDGLQKTLDENNIQQSFDAGKYVVTLQEAIADGKYVYVTAGVHAKDGQPIILLPLDAAPDDPIALWAGRTDGGSKEDKEQRTFLQKAKEEGKRLAAVNLWYQCGAASNDLADFNLLPDGSVTFVLGGDLVTGEKSLPVDLTLSIRELTAEGEYQEDQKDREIFRFDLPVTPPLAKKTIQGDGSKVPDTNASIDRVELMLTPLTMHYAIYYTIDPEIPSDAGAIDMNGLWFKFVDETGREIRGGLSLSGSRDSWDDIHFTQTGSLMMEQMPDVITIQGYDYETKELFGTAVLKVE